MSSNDCDAINLSLVLTYIPAMLLFLRAALLLCCYGVMHSVLQVPPSVLMCSLLLLAYLDWFCFRTDRLSKACGHLAPLVLCLVANAELCSQECPGSALRTTLYYANSVAWATASSYVFANQMLQLKYPVHDLAVVALVCTHACLHLVVHCHHDGLPLVVARVASFYPISIAHWFAQVLVPDADRNRFSFTVLHTSVHFLFVDFYVVAGSVLIFVLVLVYCIKQQSPGPQTAPKSAPCMFDAEAQDSMSALVSELRAAKQAQSLR